MANNEDIKRIVDQTVKKFGQIDILVNSAGLSRIRGLTEGDDMPAYDTIMSINVHGLVNLTILAAPYHAKTKGNIVNISSAAAFFTPVVPGAISYYISKAAVNYKCAAAELALYGIRVNIISPGPVKTDFFENGGIDIKYEDFEKMASFGRVSEPEEIANIFIFLANDKAKGITGSNFLADNGMVIKRG